MSRRATQEQLAYREKLFGWHAPASVQRLSDELDACHRLGAQLTARKNGVLLLRAMAKEGL